MNVMFIECSKLMKKQFFNGKFWRYYVVVKYMFIKEYYKNKKPEEFIYVIYNKLYKGISKHKRIKDQDFISLINSFEESGYDMDFPISVGKKDKYLCGGSHRFACCLWFELPTVPIELHPKCGRKKDRFSGHWMRIKGFEKDMKIIKKYKREIFKKLGI